MSITMHAAAVPLMKTLLGAMSGVLKKGAAHAEARKIEPSVLLNARLFPDMFPLARQVQIATDGARGAVFRLAGKPMVSVPDTETTFDELEARIAATIGYLEACTPEDWEGAEEREVVLQMRVGELRFTGQRYLFGFVLPNFTFHCTTAYNILRHSGVELGKRDFLGSF